MTESGDATPALAVVELARQLELSIATAESLTAGMVAAELATVPGASAVLKGGVVAYHRDVKEALLGVDQALLSRVGTVDMEVAQQMAEGAMRACGSDAGVATTGVAGPEPHEGKDVGVVVVAVVLKGVRVALEFHFDGDRSEIRQAASNAAVRLLHQALLEAEAGTNGVPQ